MSDEELEKYRNDRRAKVRPEKVLRDRQLRLLPDHEDGYRPLTGRVTPVGDMDFNFRNYVR